MNKIIASMIKPSKPGSGAAKLTKRGFIENVKAIRKRARQHIEEGAVTDT